MGVWGWRDRQTRIGGLSWVGVFLVALAFGCENSRFKQASETRERRIQRTVATWAAYDLAGGERIRSTVRAQRKAADLRAEHLDRTRELMRSQHEEKVHKWRAERPLRVRRIHEVLAGHPETCPRTWAKMVY